MKQNKIISFIVLCLLAPATTAAQVSSITFTTEPQNIKTQTPSEALTLGVQDVSGGAVSIPQTGCIALTTSSQTGQFSSSATNWNPLTVLTMSKGTSNRSFFYQDSAEGLHTLTAVFALKPMTISASCASWPQTEWGSTLTTTQTIRVGTATQAPSSGGTSNQTPDSSETNSPILATTQETTYGSAAPVETLSLKTRSQPVAVVGAGSFFSSAASDSRGLTGAETRYIWNLGDGTTREGQTIFHTYSYPGTYVVFLTAAAGTKSGTARTHIQVVPAPIGLLLEPDGSVVISNQSSQELNIGLWSITSGMKTFPIPPDTILLGGQSIHFSPETMHMVAGADVELRYPNNTLVQVVSSTSDAGFAPARVPSKVLFVSNGLQLASSSSTTTPSQVHPSEPTKAAVTSPALAASAASSLLSLETALSLAPYVLGALGFILIAIGLFLKKNPVESVTNKAGKEFNIQG